MNQKKIDTVADLKDKITRTKSVVLADYRGLTHKQAEELHRTLKKVNGEFAVVKNTLLKIAAKEAGHDMLAKNSTSGPVGALFSYEDEFTPLRELAKFAKSAGFPTLKLSFINDKEYDAERTGYIATLPDVSTLQAQLVYTLNANMQKFVYILSQIKPTTNAGGDN